MSRGYNQTRARHAAADEAARQRGLLMQSLQAPQRTETPIVRPNNALLGTVEERNAFADEMLRRERANNAAAQSDEVYSEGRQQRPEPAPVNYAIE